MNSTIKCRKYAAKKNGLIVKLIEIQALIILRRPSTSTDASSAALTSSTTLVPGSDLVAFLLCHCPTLVSYVVVPRRLHFISLY